MNESLKNAGWTTGGVIAGGAIGAKLGSDIGIAAFGTAIAGTWPVGIIFAIAGGVAAKYLRSRFLARRSK